MRKFVYIFLTLLLLGIFIIIFAYINQDKLIDRFVERQSQSAEFRYELLENESEMVLITVGTGSSVPSDRIQSGNAIFSDGKFIVVDAGAGVTDHMENLRLPLDRLDGVFITHWHSDHFIDLPNLVNRSWQLGRSRPLTIYGPEPVDSIVHGINEMLRSEISYRWKHHGAKYFEPALGGATHSTIHLQGDECPLVFSEGGLSVSAFGVNHQPVDPSFGYVITSGSKKLVITGDTKKSENVIRHARDADILVHDAMQKEFIQRASRLQKDLGNERNAHVVDQMQQYHASPAEAAEVAEQAGVSKLILTHLTPAPENPISRRFYKLGLDKIFGGPIILAEDGDVFYIK